MTPPSGFKRPVSVLVVVHTPTFEVLLLERVAPPGFWQSVTGSLEADETPAAAALRELAEETGIVAVPAQLVDWQRTHRFEIRPEWRRRYAPDVSHNTEHVFSLCLPERRPVRLAADEHRAQLWLPQQEAARKVFSWSNRDAILSLGQPLAPAAPGR
jgi:dATP pyrophosphohydrolase